MQTFFLQGIKGVAMANLAVILKKRGSKVYGSDSSEHFITDDLLKDHGIEVISDFSSETLPKDTEVFVYSAAHHGTESEQAKEAKKRGITLMPQTELIGQIMREFSTSIAVCGCHGKTTTSSLLAYALKNLATHPSYIIGTSTFNSSWGGDYDGKNYFVVEADEYGVNPPLDKTPKFHLLHPTHTLCLNIDFDHPDVYKDIEETKKAFEYFFTQSSSHLFLCADNQNLMEVALTLPRERYKTFGFAETADFPVKNPVITEDYSQFELAGERYQISVFGLHNIINAAGVITVLLSLGFEPTKIKEAVKDFTGAKRRFEKVAYENNIYLFDDYAHHPEEIESTILSAKERFKQRRTVVIFQPHTFSRTESLKNEFVSALAKADLAFIAPIFPSAREQKPENAITSEDLVKIAREKGFMNIFSFQNESELLEMLQKNLRQGDVVFTVGAGDIYKMKNGIIEVLKLCSNN